MILVSHTNVALPRKPAPLPKPKSGPDWTKIKYNSGKRIGNVYVIEVYVNDFIGATNNLTQEHLLHFSCAILHNVHSISPPKHITKYPGGNSISKKKIGKVIEGWDFTNEILGWICNGKEFTIQLLVEKSKTMLKLIKKCLKFRSILLKRFQSLAVKLQRAAFVIPGGSSLFFSL